MICILSELRPGISGRGSEEDERSEHEDDISVTGSDHMTMDVERSEDDVIAVDSEIESSVSNPLEDSEYFSRCQVTTNTRSRAHSIVYSVEQLCYIVVLG